jgi:hypothetical protein
MARRAEGSGLNRGVRFGAPIPRSQPCDKGDNVSLGERLLDIAVGGAGNLHGDIGRHDTAFDGDDETLLPVF